MDYPLGRDVFGLMEKAKPKTFGDSFEEQLEISEKLYGCNISFNYSEKDIDNVLSQLTDYAKEEKDRVKEIILQTKRKYEYLFK
jgi:hypothetical protein